MARVAALIPRLPFSVQREATPDAGKITDIDAHLSEGAGYVVLHRLLAPEVVDSVLRLLNLEIVRRGLSTSEIGQCSQSTFFPHLRWEPEILGLRSEIEKIVPPREGEQWADAQLLLRFPDEATEWPLTSHVDALPHWAPDRSYRAIVGAALSSSKQADGCLVVWPRSHVGAESDPTPVELSAGDVVIMHPALRHSGSLNTGGTVRYAIYFRLLHASPGTP